MPEWEHALDAMEAWVRRTAEAARAGEPAPEAPALPLTRLPKELGLRARALLVAMQQAEAGVARTRAKLQQQQAYGAA